MAKWLWIVLLVIIHTFDMEVTYHYIGNRWESEMFPPMSYCIKNYGIEVSMWISRVIMYSLIFVVLLANNHFWRCVLATVTVLYWAAMTSWLFTLGIIEWPKIPWVKRDKDAHSVLISKPDQSLGLWTESAHRRFRCDGELDVDRDA